MTAAQSSPIRLMLFDLDDTLWDMPATLAHAEGQWQAFMAQRGYGDLAQHYRDPRQRKQKVAAPVVAGRGRGLGEGSSPAIRLLLFDLDDTLWDLEKTLDVAEGKWQAMMRRWG
ncbi:hypothetical protein FOZ63_002697, partial [Perkinsus olseni]